MAEKDRDATPTIDEVSVTTSHTQTPDRSKDKGKGILLEEDVTDVMNLKPEDLARPLELKVYRKWASRNVPDPNPTGLCFILLDKKVSNKCSHTNMEITISKCNRYIITYTYIIVYLGRSYPGECPALGHQAV